MLAIFLHCLVVLSACDCASTEDTSKRTSQDVSGKKLNILMASDFMFGHMAKVLPLGEELVQRGHNVTLLLMVYEHEKLIML